MILIGKIMAIKLISEDQVNQNIKRFRPVSLNDNLIDNLSSGESSFVDNLFTKNIPVGRPSSGSIADNGALTLTTALQTTYSQGAYMYFPANAIVSGSAAGLYWTVMSSTTLGTIYNNTYTSGTPIEPTTLVPFVTTGPGAFTQTTAEIDLIQTTILGGSIGKNGNISITLQATYNNSAGSKSIKAKLGSLDVLNSTQTTTVYAWAMRSIQNCNNEAIQLSQSLGATGPVSSASASIRGTINTATDQIFSFPVLCNTATDFFFYEQYIVTLTKNV